MKHVFMVEVFVLLSSTRVNISNVTKHMIDANELGAPSVAAIHATNYLVGWPA